MAGIRSSVLERSGIRVNLELVLQSFGFSRIRGTGLRARSH